MTKSQNKIPLSLVEKLLRLSVGPKSKGNKRKRRNRQRRSKAQTPMALTGTQRHHAALLQTPFSGPVSGSGTGFYSGEQGTYNRFVVDTTVGLAATETCGVYLLHPNSGYNNSVAAVNGNSAISYTPAFNALSPGQVYLTANASKQRSLAASIRFAIPGLSITTLTGEFCVGIASADTVNSFTTVNQFFTHAAARGQVSKDYHEVRWYPGSFDDKYSVVTATSLAATGTDTSDTNSLFIAFRGLPVSTSISVQACSVVEWTPKPGVGIAPTMTHSAGTNHQHTVQAMHEHNPTWNHTVKAAGEHLLQTGMKEFEKFVPRMLEGGLAAFGI